MNKFINAFCIFRTKANLLNSIGIINIPRYLSFLLLSYLFSLTSDFLEKLNTWFISSRFGYMIDWLGRPFNKDL